MKGELQILQLSEFINISKAVQSQSRKASVWAARWVCLEGRLVIIRYRFSTHQWLAHKVRKWMVCASADGTAGGMSKIKAGSATSLLITLTTPPCHAIAPFSWGKEETDPLSSSTRCPCYGRFALHLAQPQCSLFPKSPQSSYFLSLKPGTQTVVSYLQQRLTLLLPALHIHTQLQPTSACMHR